MAKPARIVIVEDHKMVMQMLAHLIKDHLKLTVAAECATFAAGLAACLRDKPDLAIIDWMLPDGRGFDIVRQAGPKLPQTRWICVSSNEQEHLVREAIELGIHGFVLKQSDFQILCDAIVAVLKGESFYCPSSAQLYVEAMRSQAGSLAVNLTSREREVLRGIGRGESPKVIASALGLEVKTVHNHLANIKDKLSIHEAAGLVRYAIKHGYAEAP
jgi:DNA-binding NarL/FixJ family response regulator